MKKSFTQQKTVKRLASYSTFAGAFLLLNSGANAQIIYTDISDETLGTGDVYDLDMNDDGDVDFTITNASTVIEDFFFLITAPSIFYDGLINLFQIYPESGNGVDGYVKSFTTGGTAAYPNALNAGNDIGPDNTMLSNSFQFMAVYQSAIGFGSASVTTYVGGLGDWTNKSSKFLGVRFSSGGDDFYGWIRLTTSDFEITIEDYAYYDAPDATIGAGDMPTAIENQISDTQLNAYSFGNTINIVVKDFALEGSTVNVFNIEGQKVYSGELATNGMNIALDNKATGNYTLQVISPSNEVYSRKVYIQN